MLNLTLGVPSQASKSVKFSISPMLMSDIALVESKKDYSAVKSSRANKTDRINRTDMIRQNH
jgi:hypothetical protein